MAADVDVLIVGGGVVGLGTAFAVTCKNRTIALIERHPKFGMETSTHNSCVIHAGIYYPQDSLKARLCVEGRELLYDYCARRQVDHVRCGKLIIAANDSEIAPLEALAARATANGAEVRWLSAVEVTAREPFARGTTALLSPSSGILSAEQLVRAMVHDCTAHDVALLPGSSMTGAAEVADGLEVATTQEKIVARVVVNAAGLYADDVSRILGGEEFRIYPCRGEYAELSPKWRQRFKGLLYPVPAGFGHLGVHVTPTTWGSVLLGPTARNQDRKDDYEVDRVPLDSFLEPTRALVPEVTAADLQPGGTGIRAQLRPADGVFCDFMIRRDARQPRLIQAAGIDSPGLTASLAIGRMVAGLVDEVIG